MKKNEYTAKWVKAIKASLSNEARLNDIVNKIYEEGYEDGVSSTCELF